MSVFFTFLIRIARHSALRSAAHHQVKNSPDRMLLLSAFSLLAIAPGQRSCLPLYADCTHDMYGCCYHTAALCHSQGEKEEADHDGGDVRCGIGEAETRPNLIKTSV